MTFTDKWKRVQINFKECRWHLEADGYLELVQAFDDLPDPEELSLESSQEAKELQAKITKLTDERKEAEDKRDDLAARLNRALTALEKIRQENK